VKSKCSICNGRFYFCGMTKADNWVSEYQFDLKKNSRTSALLAKIAAVNTQFSIHKAVDFWGQLWGVDMAPSERG
jgi:hypothetical protein